MTLKISIACESDLVIIGAGGLGSEAAWVADAMNAHAIQEQHPAHWTMIRYADDDAAKRGTLHVGRAVYGSIEDISRDFVGRDLHFFCAIGDNDARAKMVHRAANAGWKPATLKHPSAIVANSVQLGPGSYVGAGSVISVNVKIGAHVIVNMCASVGHDAIIEDFSQVSPGARISGYCNLGRYALVGSNATLMPGACIGNAAVVGANSLAHGFVEPNTTVCGVPARVIARRERSNGDDLLLASSTVSRRF